MFTWYRGHFITLVLTQTLWVQETWYLDNADWFSCEMVSRIATECQNEHNSFVEGAPGGRKKGGIVNFRDSLTK